MADFSTPDDMAVEEVVTKTRNKLLPREMQINADGPYLFCRWTKGRIDGGELVDQTKHLERIMDTVDEEGNPDSTEYTDIMASKTLSNWIIAQPTPPTFLEALREAMYMIAKFKGIGS